MKVLEFCAEEAFPRADVFFSEKSGLTRSAVKKLAEEGRLFVGGAAAKASQGVKAGDTVRAEIPDPQPIDARPEDIPLDIVYEDAHLAVVNKPQGMTVHAGNGNREGTLVNALLFRLDSLSGDKDTSGLLVVAKNDGAHLSLSEQIKEKSCKREYLALLEGVLKEDTGRIVTQIGRDKRTG